MTCMTTDTKNAGLGLAWSLVFFFLLAFPTASVSAAPAKLVVADDRDYPPYIFLDASGAPKGILVDIWNLWGQKTGIPVEYRLTEWSAALAAVRNGQADVVGGLARTPRREELFDLTAKITEVPSAIFFHSHLGGIKNLKDLAGFSIGIVSGDAARDSVLARHPELRFALFPGTPELVAAAISGEIKVFIADAPVARHYLARHERGADFRQASDLISMHALHGAVRKGNAEVLAVVQDGFSRISDAEVAAILDDWSGSRVHASVPWGLIVSGFGLLSLVLLGAFLWNFTLRRRVREKTGLLEASVRAVRDSAEKYRLLVEHQTDLVVKVDTAGRFLYVSPAYCRVFGKTEEELLNSTFMPLIHPEDLASTEEAMKGLLAPPYTAYIEQRAMTVNGWRWLAWNDSAILGADGAVEAVIGVGRDISERKETEERLRQSEEKFSRLFKLSPDAISLSDPESGLLVEINDAYASLTGYGREELVGRSSVEMGLFVDAQGRGRVIDELRRTGQVKNMEVAFRRKNGGDVPCSVSGQLVTIGRERFLLAVIRDMTEFKRMQEMMIQSEKMVSVGGIAAGIAHEINNPLGIIVQTAQNLVQRTRPDFHKNIEVARSIGLDMALLEKYMRARKILPFVQDMQSAAQRAAEIIRHMLDFSRRSESRRAVCALATIVDRAVSLAQNDYDLKKSFDFKKIRIVKDYASDLAQIECTETELEQVLLNLLRNAAQAMSTVEPPLNGPSIAIRLSNSSFGVRCEVEDNGPGIPEDVRRRVFEPFYTTKPPGVGTGLGLSVSYFIVTRGHGGKMWVEPASGTGARFVMELPVGAAREQKGPEGGTT